VSKEKQIARLRKAWVQKVGANVAVARLISGGLSISTAEKICADRYPSTLRDKLCEVLLAEMAKDGFELAGMKAS
jgi:hypothetical protein